MKVIIFSIVLMVLIASCSPSRTSAARQPVFTDQESFRTLPSKALIEGVPFISWNEASRLEYQSKDILNPSLAASIGMILKHWEQDLSLLKDEEAALPKGPNGWGISGTGQARGIDDIKPFIARGIPVVIDGAVTPMAHPMMPTYLAFAAAKGLKIQPKGPSSGVLGRMEPFETFQQLGEFLAKNKLPMKPWESLFESVRVVIGYDDNRKIITMHDPTFGPAWEVSYSDFAKMWRYSDNWYLYAFPSHYADLQAKRSPASYPSRTADQLAAARYLFAYALESINKLAMAEEEINKGMSVPMISKGYQHLFLLELAVIRLNQGKAEEAIAVAQKAAELLPEHFRAWDIMSAAYNAMSTAGSRERANDALSKADALSKCSPNTEIKGTYGAAIMKTNDYLEPQRTVARTLAQNFFIYSGCRNTTVLWLLKSPD